MKNYTEEWTVIINKNKYILNEERTNIVKNMINEGKGGTVMFDDYFINIPFIEEFYLSNKIFNVNKQLPTGEKEISKEEKDRLTKKMAEFKKNFFQKHILPKKMTDTDVNSRQNELRKQAKKL